MLTKDSYGKQCSLKHTCFFKKGETILMLSDHTGRCGLLMEGEAHISMVNENGQDNILEVLTPGDSFGEHYMGSMGHDACYVLADSDCKVTFINMNTLLNGCTKACDQHMDMMRTLLLLSARHSQNQALHLNVLSQRTLREKLMTFLQYQEQFVPPGEEFQLPMSLVSLASYLCVDRSAMMREIKKMNQDGLIRSSGRNFTIL